MHVNLKPSLCPLQFAESYTSLELAKGDSGGLRRFEESRT